MKFVSIETKWGKITTLDKHYTPQEMDTQEDLVLIRIGEVDGAEAGGYYCWRMSAAEFREFLLKNLEIPE